MSEEQGNANGAAPGQAATAGTSSPGLPLGRVEGVPSEQLWRAAILAARQAALSAAELRRAIEERA